ncbi:LysR substrate-binding domain-containing protein, partial [Klebsiella pneumoniae]
AIAAVLSQQGVALVPKMYVESELSAGTLVAPWPGSPTLAKRFCLIKPGGGEGEPALQMFERWLQTEIAAG